MSNSDKESKSELSTQLISGKLKSPHITQLPVINFSKALNSFLVSASVVSGGLYNAISRVTRCPFLKDLSFFWEGKSFIFHVSFFKRFVLFFDKMSFFVLFYCQLPCGAVNCCQLPCGAVNCRQLPCGAVNCRQLPCGAVNFCQLPCGAVNFCQLFRNVLFFNLKSFFSRSMFFFYFSGSGHPDFNLGAKR